MKKLVTAAVTATMLLCSAGAAMAASASDIDLSGDLRFHYRWQTYDWQDDKEGGKVWFRLNAKAALSDSVDAYARLAIQKLTGDHIGADFNQDYRKYSEDGATAIDRFGLVFKGKDLNYNLGRQGLTLGSLALMYSTEGYMGSNIGAVEGLVITGKSGATNLKVVAGETEHLDVTSDDAKIYALEASYSPAKDWTVGGLYAKYDHDSADTNHWAVNVGKNIGKANLAVEYGKSDADTEDTAYAGGASYAFDNKNSVWAYYFKVEENADMGGLTDWDSGQKGVYYGYDRQLREDTTLSFLYKKIKDADGTANSTQDSLRATVTYRF